MSRTAVWIHGVRPRTLGIGVAAVLVGSLAAPTGSAERSALALLVALGLQIAVNLANDAADGARGVDADRVGPMRLVASGAASGRAVWTAAALSTLIAALAGLRLAVLVGPELLIVGAIAIVAMLGYSAGPRPYASLGLGELMVFAFFGPAAVIGTAYVEAERVVDEAVWASIPLGLLAVAVMLANNIRDVPTDEASGKRTLCVRLGDARSRRLFRAVLLAAFFAIPVAVLLEGLPPATLLSLAGWPLVATPWRESRSAHGAEWVPVLQSTALLHLQVSIGCALGLAFS